MKHLNKYNNFSVNEGQFEDDNRDKLLPDLVDIVQDLIDDGYNVWFESASGRINATDYSDKVDVSKFNPTFKAGNKIKNRFNIIINSSSAGNHIDNEELSKIISEMTTVINRISDSGWEFDNFDISTARESNKENTNFRFTNIKYKFIKPEEVTDAELPTVEEIKAKFANFGLNAEDIEYEIDANMCHVGAESFAYNGEIPEDIEDKLTRMIDELGFDYYEHELDGTDWLSVKFWINPD